MSTQKNEHNPTPEQIGQGWRLLNDGERVQHDDQWWNRDDAWLKVTSADVGHCYPHAIIRRRITPPTDTTGSGSEGETEKPWLVWSNEHRAWWGPNRAGYFTKPASAGRYTKEEADQICDTRSKVEGKPPPEVAVLASTVVAPEDEVVELRAQVEALRRDGELVDLLEKFATIRWPIVADHRNIAAIAFGVEAAEPFTEKPTVRAILRAAIDSAQRQEGE